MTVRHNPATATGLNSPPTSPAMSADVPGRAFPAAALPMLPPLGGLPMLPPPATDTLAAIAAMISSAAPASAAAQLNVTFSEPPSSSASASSPPIHSPDGSVPTKAKNERCAAGASGAEPAGGDKPLDPRLVVPTVILPHPLVDPLIEKHRRKGILIPLKTTSELCQDHTLVPVYITRVPTKAANNVVSLVRTLLPDGQANGLPHLRRCAKPMDIPTHLKTQFMNETDAGRLIHTGRSNWIYVLLGQTRDLDRDTIVARLAQVDGMGDPPIDPASVFVTVIPAPLVPPTSQIQAALWTTGFWPTVYRKNCPLGPHPGIVGRATNEIRGDASVWMALAHRIASRSRETGMGEPAAAVIVHRAGSLVQLVAVAGDARWHQEPARGRTTGNPLAHCVLRAISMVAQKLVRDEGRQPDEAVRSPPPRLLMYDALQDSAIMDEEKEAYEAEHPNPDGYLCHGLEMYLTHEPCVQCSMSILHSRMGKVVFGKRMPRTGGITSEDRGHGRPELNGAGGRGLGLFWRRELNWSLLAWEWEAGGEPGAGVTCLKPIRPVTHI